MLFYLIFVLMLNYIFRYVFNRIVGLGLTVKRMKFIFKKFLDFEKVHGGEETIEKVKEMAAKYVENNSSSMDAKIEAKDKSGDFEANLKKNLNV